jgi:hypothetical protein
MKAPGTARTTVTLFSLPLSFQQENLGTLANLSCLSIDPFSRSILIKRTKAVYY